MQLRGTSIGGLLLLIVLLLTACGSETEGTPTAGDGEGATAIGPKRGGTLEMSLGNEFVTFHPYFDVTNSNFKPTFFEAPIRISDAGDFEPWLAESWQEAENGLSVTLKFRPGIIFHNGREMTADDMLWSLNYARNPEFNHQLSDRFETVTGAEKLDNLTVRINYSEQTASQLDALLRLYIFPQEALETIETVPVGTGPFRFVEWIPGDSLTVERFDAYWRKGFPYLDKIVVRPLIDAETRSMSLRMNTVDLLLNVPLADKAALAAEEGFVVGVEPPGFYFYAFMMNINVPPFDEMKVRQAFNYAINRDEIADTVFQGEALTATVPYPPTSWAFAEDLTTYYIHDLEKAKALLAEAGYPAGFSVEMLVRATDEDDPLLKQAQVYQKQLAAIGIEVQLVPAELPEYWDRLTASNFSIVSHATGNPSVDPSGLFESAACCRSFNNFFGVQDRTEAWFVEYRDVINQARVETDPEVRKQLYHRVLEILLEQGWTVPTVWIQSTYAHWAYVQDFRTALDGTIWLGETWLDE